MKHETKYCARCANGFECKVGSVNLCQCSTVILNDVERDYIRSLFTDCLCAECMKALKGEYHARSLKEKLRRLLREVIS